MRSMNHKNVIKLHEVYETKNNIVLVLPYLVGGELLARINQKGLCRESDA